MSKVLSPLLKDWSSSPVAAAFLMAGRLTWQAAGLVLCLLCFGVGSSAASAYIGTPPNRQTSVVTPEKDLLRPVVLPQAKQTDSGVSRQLPAGAARHGGSGVLSGVHHFNNARSWKSFPSRSPQGAAAVQQQDPFPRMPMVFGKGPQKPWNGIAAGLILAGLALMGFAWTKTGKRWLCRRDAS